MTADVTRLRFGVFSVLFGDFSLSLFCYVPAVSMAYFLVTGSFTSEVVLPAAVLFLFGVYWSSLRVRLVGEYLEYGRVFGRRRIHKSRVRRAENVQSGGFQVTKHVQIFFDKDLKIFDSTYLMRDSQRDKWVMEISRWLDDEPD